MSDVGPTEKYLQNELEMHLGALRDKRAKADAYLEEGKLDGYSEMMNSVKWEETRINHIQEQISRMILRRR